MTLSPSRISRPSRIVLPLDHADAEAGQVVLARLVELGQDRRLAAEQGALGLDAAVADPLDDLAGQLRVVAAHGHVVEEQQRLGPGAEAVVDRHGDQVDADRRVPAGGEGELELRADAVGRGDEHRVAVGAREQADVGRRAGTGRRTRRSTRSRAGVYVRLSSGGSWAIVSS